ncbi:hypothetical protein niasHT_031394 [Heterodera trifolii]|uniref:Uncharacterized protein n=1 Tax=Heterodera trifolii TaxID=157864 RepID=A0ABD2J3X3_9BILA
MSQPRQAKTSQPRPAKMSQPRQANMSQPRQAKTSQPRPAKMSQPRQANMSQPRPAKTSQPRQAKMSQPRQAKDEPSTTEMRERPHNRGATTHSDGPSQNDGCHVSSLGSVGTLRFRLLTKLFSSEGRSSSTESLLALSPENNGAMLEVSPDSVFLKNNAGKSVPITAESNEKALGSTVLKESGEFVQTNSGENDKTSLEIVKIVSPLETMGALIGVISQKDDESVEKVPQDSSEKANAGEMEVEGDAKALGSSILSVEAQIEPNPMANSDQVEIENEEVEKGENEQF